MYCKKDEKISFGVDGGIAETLSYRPKIGSKSQHLNPLFGWGSLRTSTVGSTQRSTNLSSRSVRRGFDAFSHIPKPWLRLQENCRPTQVTTYQATNLRSVSLRPPPHGSGTAREGRVETEGNGSKGTQF